MAPEDMEHNGDHFKCEQCDKIFQTRRLLSYHIRDVHIDKVRCDCCDKTFSKLSNMKKHKKNKSATTNDKLKCDCCDKTFSNTSNLKKHKNTQSLSSEILFQCTEVECQKIIWFQELTGSSCI